MHHDDFAPGSVWLVGAGPGDPDLLTRKAARLIAEADLVFHDALVGTAILDLVPAHVRLVNVGKRSGRHSKDQGSINDLIVAAALAGQRVVRLKGGDPSIFGRSAEEIDALSRHGIAVRICPGITAASAAAAGANASLTLRGSARQLTFVTAHARAGEKLVLDWAKLADQGSMLAIYMGRAAATDIARELIAAGRDPDTPVLIAVNVSLPNERLIRGRLSALAFLVRAISEDDPTLLLIGTAIAPGKPAAHMLAPAGSSDDARVANVAEM
jgi:uroporphyrin-III C-methyltransferase